MEIPKSPKILPVPIPSWLLHQAQRVPRQRLLQPRLVVAAARLGAAEGPGDHREIHGLRGGGSASEGSPGGTAASLEDSGRICDNWYKMGPPRYN